MEQRDWEERLDRYADQTAHAVRKGVNVLEDAFDKGKETLKEEAARKEEGAGAGESSEPAPNRGSRRLGLVLVFLGIIWLLHSLGILDQPVFPILLVILGIYFLTRSK
jgi:hypothetical protein